MVLQQDQDKSIKIPYGKDSEHRLIITTLIKLRTKLMVNNSSLKTQFFQKM